MPLDYDIVKSWPIADVEQLYGVRDTILYNLGVGAGVVDDASDVDLDFVWEKQLKSVPTIAAVLGEGANWMSDPRSTITWTNMVHAEQSIVWHRPLPAEGHVLARSQVEEVYDKGKGAILAIVRDLSDAASGQALATVRISIFLRSDGGFGGTAKAPSPRTVPSDRDADRAVSLRTRPEQALLYRLSGDYYPLHVSPDFAADIGFSGPILHGLATYGVAARALLLLCCNRDPARMRRLDARFTAPVYPGETITTKIWQLDAGTAQFQCDVGGRIVLDHGWLEYAP